MLCTCGPESKNIVLTFFLMNTPLVLFAILTYSDFEDRLLSTLHIAMIPVVNFWFMLVCSTDPGIIPARTW